MENELILLFVEYQKPDEKRGERKAERIEKMVYVEHLSVQDTAAEHFRYGIHRVCHQHIAEELVADFKRINFIDYRSHIKEKQTEYFIEIINIFEENIKRTENQSDSDRKNKQDEYRNRGEKNVGCNMRGILPCNAEENYEADKHYERDKECDEI